MITTKEAGRLCAPRIDMEKWLESVHSDGTEEFVSNPHPALNEKVKIRIRMYDDAPVKAVILRSLPNGGERMDEMYIAKKERGFVYYEAELLMADPRLQYHFYLVCENAVYFFNQREISTVMPSHRWDFVLMADYVQPKWVRDAVFYQIFPERFCNGDEKNDVQSGEYSLDGCPSIKMDSWNCQPLSYAEGHCLDFFGGDLQGVEQKIPYLKALGVTAVYLNPIFAAPTAHKYDCIDFFHVDPHFGGDEALASLSKALHENGMKLILDISINHTGATHKWFNRGGTFFPENMGAYNNPAAPERDYYFFNPDGSYHGWAGVDNLPTLNYSSEALRDIIYRSESSVLKKWLKPPYSIDGWRFDVADVVGRNGEVQLSHRLWREIRRSIRAENPEAYILAEDWGDSGEYLQGDMWDSPMNYWGCGRAIRQFLGEADLFMMRSSVLRKYFFKMSAEDLKSRVMNHLAAMPHALQENQFNLFDSHDASRLHNNPAIHPEEYRGAVIFQFMLPGAPSIYYGDEAEIAGSMESMEDCRYPMPWNKDIESCAAYRLNKTMADAKHKHLAMRSGSFRFLYAENDIIALARFTPEEAIVAVISTNKEDADIRLPLAAVGATEPAAELFGREMQWRRADRRSVIFRAKAHTSYVFECKMV